MSFPFVLYEKVSDLRLLHDSQVAGAKLGRSEKCDRTARKRRNTPFEFRSEYDFGRENHKDGVVPLLLESGSSLLHNLTVLHEVTKNIIIQRL